MADEFRAEKLIFMMKKVGLNLVSQLELNLKYQNMSGSQVYFMVYILRHHPKGTYLTELYREIGVSKSTLSTKKKKLRKEGYLCIEENPDDIRKKKLIPTKKLEAEGKEFLQKAEYMESEICNGLEPDERVQLYNLEQKILRHLAEMEHNQTKNRQEV